MPNNLITIFGGSGFIGRYIVNLVAKHGYRIRIAVRDTEKASFLSTSGEMGQISFYPTSVKSKKDIKRAIHGSDFVINCVGILFERSNRTFKDIHINSAKQIAKISNDENIKQLIHFSALGANEESNSKYAKSKFLGEKQVIDEFPSAIIIRPSVVFGNEDKFLNMFGNWARFSPVLPYFSHVVPHLEGGGGTKFQPVYVGDIARAVKKIISENSKYKGKVYELTGPNIFDMRRLLKMVCNYTNRKPLIWALPFWLGQIASQILQFFPSPPITPDQITLLKSDNISSGKHCGFKELKINPTPIETVIPGYLKRFRPHQQQKIIRNLVRNNLRSAENNF